MFNDAQWEIVARCDDGSDCGGWSHEGCGTDVFSSEDEALAAIASIAFEGTRFAVREVGTLCVLEF